VGQKTHPYGFRLGIVKPWRSRYFARRDFPELLKEDDLIRQYLKTRLSHAAIADVHVERKPGKVTVTVHTGRDAESGEIVEARLQSRKIAALRKRAEMQFIEYGFLARAAAPSVVGPGEGARVDDFGGAVHVVGIETRGGIGQQQFAVAGAVPVAAAGSGIRHEQTVPTVRARLHAQLPRGTVFQS
jgi:hypothetical protein